MFGGGDVVEEGEQFSRRNVGESLCCEQDSGR